MPRKTLEERVAEAEKRFRQLQAQKQKQALQEKAAAKKRERAEDTNRKIRLGGLVVLSELASADKGFLLGAMLDAAQRQRDEQFFARCKAMGDALLAEQADANKKSAAAQAQG